MSNAKQGDHWDSLLPDLLGGDNPTDLVDETASEEPQESSPEEETSQPLPGDVFALASEESETAEPETAEPTPAAQTSSVPGSHWGQIANDLGVAIDAWEEEHPDEDEDEPTAETAAAETAALPAEKPEKLEEPQAEPDFPELDWSRPAAPPETAEALPLGPIAWENPPRTPAPEGKSPEPKSTEAKPSQRKSTRSRRSGSEERRSRSEERRSRSEERRPRSEERQPVADEAPFSLDTPNMLDSIFSDDADFPAPLTNEAPPIEAPTPVAEEEEEAPRRRRRRRRGGRRDRTEAERVEEPVEEDVFEDAPAAFDEPESDFEAVVEPLEEEEESEERPKRRRRRRRRKSSAEREESTREERDEPEELSEEEPPARPARRGGRGGRGGERSSERSEPRESPAAQEDDSEDGMDGKHRKIPTWQDAMELVITTNLDNRTREPRRGRGRGRR